MASYPSHHEILDTNYREYVVDAYAKYLAFETKVNEDTYQLTIFCECDKEKLAIDAEACILATEIREKRRIAKEAAKKAQQEKDLQSDLDRKRLQFEKLKKELGE